MIIALLVWLLHHHLPLCEAGFALVYGALSILSWRHRPHAVAYGTAAILAVALATCAALAH
jgi:hypothetical protein